MKNELLKGLPYIIGTGVLFPLLLIIVNFIFFRGNGVKPNDIDKYIKDSKINIVDIPDVETYNQEKYYIKLVRYGKPVFIDRYVFYSPENKKYLELILFDYFDDFINWMQRGYLLSDSVTISARINQYQLMDSVYGTKEKPVPVFAIDLLKSNIAGSDDKKFFHISDTLNRIFVEQYLNHFMPKEEFKKMFRK